MCKTILCLVLSLGTAHAGLSRLGALSMIESADDDAAVGNVGEVSRFQIKPWIWKLYSQSEDYQNPVIASYVAERHLGTLEQAFRKQSGRQPTDFDLYVLWNAGPTYYKRIEFSKARVHPVIRERATRYANLREARNLQPSDLATVQEVRPAPSTNPPQVLLTSSPTTTTPFSTAGRSPLMSFQPSTGLQHPMFSILPLTSEPQDDSSPNQGILAVGGIPAK